MEPIEWGLMIGGIIVGILGHKHGRTVAKNAVKVHRSTRGTFAKMREEMRLLVEEAEAELEPAIERIEKAKA